MKNIDVWMDELKDKLLALFGERLVYLGLQGSYARGEAAANSDLDVVLILDQVNLTDLQLYQKAIAALPDGALVCGFFGGKEQNQQPAQYFSH